MGAQSAVAQTTVAPVISSDQVWDISGSPYLITQNTYIDTGVSVTVMPGVEVRFQSTSIRIIVDGSFQAKGTEDSTILLDQGQIYYRSSADSYDPADGSGAYFNYCVFTGAGVGKRSIDLYYISALVENCKFINTYYSINNMASSFNPVTLDVLNCTFTDSNLYSFPIYTSGRENDVTIRHCTFNLGSTLLIGGKVVMENNTVNEFRRIQISSYGGTIVRCNTFTNIEFGVEFRVYHDDSSDQLSFVHNTLDTMGFSTSYPMLKVGNYSTINTIGKFNANNNNFLTNTSNMEKVAVSGYNANPSTYEEIDFTGNYWETTDTTTIKGYIRDYSDDITVFAKADYSGYLSAPDTGCTTTIPSSCHASFYLARDTNHLYNLYIVNNSTGTSAHTGYHWTFGDGSGSSSRNPVHYYKHFGKYQICLTLFDSADNCYSTFCDSIGLDSNGLLLKQEGFTITVLDESELGTAKPEAMAGMKVYPNPGNGLITIELPRLMQGDLHIQVMEVTGRIVLDKTAVPMAGEQKWVADLSELEEGLYLLHIKSGLHETTTRVIINR